MDIGAVLMTLTEALLAIITYEIAKTSTIQIVKARRAKLKHRMVFSCPESDCTFVIKIDYGSKEVSLSAIGAARKTLNDHKERVHGS